MKFCVFGAGAVGGFVGGMVARSNTQVSLVARGDHLQAIRSRGLTIVTMDEEFTVRPDATDNPEELGPQDVIFLSAKSHTLARAAEAMQPLLGPDTVVVSAQNGIPFWYFHACDGPLDGHVLQTVDPGGGIARSIGCRRVIGCVINSSNEVREPGLVRNLGNRIFSLGEPDGSLSDRVRAVAALLEDGHLKAPLLTDIRRELWTKIWGNVSFSTMAVLTGARLGPLVERPDLRELAIVIMKEAQRVGESLGVTFNQTIDNRIEATRSVSGHKTSLLQDLERGRPMEVDGICGAVVELARFMNIPTPATDIIYALLRCRAREAGLYPETGFDPLSVVESTYAT